MVLRWSSCAISWSDLDVTFDLEAVTFNIKSLVIWRIQKCEICLGQISEILRGKKFKLDRDTHQGL